MGWHLWFGCGLCDNGCSLPSVPLGQIVHNCVEVPLKPHAKIVRDFHLQTPSCPVRPLRQTRQPSEERFSAMRPIESSNPYLSSAMMSC